MSMTPDQMIASDPKTSVWVAASAGTGKTFVLTSRVLRIMLEGTPPQRILCLTFTKAAAAEMANRINKNLSHWAVCEGSELQIILTDLLGCVPNDEQFSIARTLFAEVLDVAGGLKIQTIHAFCQSLLGKFPLEAQTAPHFQVMDERTAKEYLKRSQDAVLQDSRPDINPTLAAALSHLSTQVTEQTFSEILQEMTSRRGMLESMMRRSNYNVSLAIRKLQKTLDLQEEDTQENLEGTALLGGDENKIRSMMEALLDGTPAENKRGDILARWLSVPKDRSEIWNDYCTVFITKDFLTRKILLSKKTAERYSGVLEFMEEEAERIIDISDRQRRIIILKNTEALLHLGNAMMQAFDYSKKRHAVLDYDDLISKVTNLLSKHDVGSWILYKLDGGLDHILVDEAQDTNPEQWQVIKTLAGEFFMGDTSRRSRIKEQAEVPRTIFAVGDVKQSIYSFQRADPKEFIQTREHFLELSKQAGTGFENVNLGTSFRSAAAVLSLVDEVFNDAESRQALSFSDELVSHRPHRTGEAGLVEIWETVKEIEQEVKEDWSPPIIQKPAFSPEMRLAVKIAAQINRWIKEKELLISQARPVTAGDILILVRRRTKFDDYMISALKALDIPVAGQDKMILSEQLAVMDLIAMGKFALLPDDDLTLAVALKSPFIGMSEDDLYKLAQPRIKGRSLWAELLGRKDENESFKQAASFLKELCNDADMRPPFEFFNSLLGSRRGREKILGRLGAEAADPMDEFLQLALNFEQNNISSLQGFLSWFNAGDVAIKRDMEQGSDQVRIMTIHGAKGLQAPIVFLPDTCQMPSDRAKILWTEEKGSSQNKMLLWVGGKENETEICTSAREKIKEINEQEYKRLLYVALTRAEDRLYITGWEKKNKRQKGCWYDQIKAAFGRLEDIEEFDYDGEEGTSSLRFTSPQLKEVLPEQAAHGQIEDIEPLPSFMMLPPPAESFPPKPLVPSHMEDEEPAPLSPLKSLVKKENNQRRYHRGRLIHKLLEILPDMPKDLREKTAIRFLSQGAHDLEQDTITLLKDEVIGILEDKKLKDLFGSNSRAEVPIIGVIGQRAISGFVDRLAVLEDEVLIIDYKTNRPPPKNVSHIPKIYLRQMAAYREVLQEIYPKHTIRCALLWTDISQLMEIPEKILEGYIQK